MLLEELSRSYVINEHRQKRVHDCFCVGNAAMVKGKYQKACFAMLWIPDLDVILRLENKKLNNNWAINFCFLKLIQSILLMPKYSAQSLSICINACSVWILLINPNANHLYVSINASTMSNNTK